MQVRQIALLATLGLLSSVLAVDAFRPLSSAPSASRADNGQTRPEPVLIPNPGYVRTAFQSSYEGLVVTDVEIDAVGTVSSARIMRSSGDPALDAAAIEAARRARFTPGLNNGRPTPASQELRYLYTRSGPVFYTTVVVPSAGTRNLGSLPEPVMVPDPAVCDSVLWLKLQIAVTVLVRVDTLGSVTNAGIATSSGNPLVDRKAVEFARQARFRPGLVSGRPAASSAWIEYEFHQYKTYVSKRRVLPPDWYEPETAPTAQQR